MTNSVTQTNAARFNSIAASWDDNPVRSGIARGVAQAILERIAPAGRERALEFGAGTGLVTALLAPSLGHVVAADSATGMLAVLRRKADELGLTNVEPREADLSREVPEGPFDLIFSSMTLHHIEDVPALLARLAPALSAGGRVALADLESEDGSFHGEVAGVMHHGFDPQTVAGWLQDAGFVDIDTHRAHVVHKTGADGLPHDYPVFLATARWRS